MTGSAKNVQALYPPQRKPNCLKYRTATRLDEVHDQHLPSKHGIRQRSLRCILQRTAIIHELMRWLKCILVAGWLALLLRSWRSWEGGCRLRMNWSGPLKILDPLNKYPILKLIALDHMIEIVNKCGSFL